MAYVVRASNSSSWIGVGPINTSADLGEAQIDRKGASGSCTALAAEPRSRTHRLSGGADGAGRDSADWRDRAARDGAHCEWGSVTGP